MTAKVSALDHAAHIAHSWVGAVAAEFGTDDEEFAYRVLRAWLHTVRDRLTVEAAARFAAQLPDLIRGVFYAGWQPGAVPVKYDAAACAARFAREAVITVAEAGDAAALTTAALSRLLSPAAIDKVFGRLPEDVRRLLSGD